MLDSLLSEIAERGYILRRLSQLDSSWECSLLRALAQPRSDGYRFALGFASGPTCTIAIAQALDNLEHDFELLEPFQPTCNSALAPPLQEPMSLAALMPRPRTSFNLRVKL